MKKNIKNFSFFLSPLSGVIDLIIEKVDFTIDKIKVKFANVNPVDFYKAPFDIQLISSDIHLEKNEIDFKDLSLSTNGFLDKLSFLLTSEEVVYHKKKNGLNYITPMEIKIKGEKNINDIKLHGKLKFKKQNKIKVLTSLKYNLKSSKGFMTFKVPAIDLSPENFILKNLSPSSHSDKLSFLGILEVSGIIPLGEKNKKEVVNVKINDLSVNYDEMSLSYLNSHFKLSDFQNINSKKFHEVDINRVKMGQTIENILFKWKYQSSIFTMERFSGELFGGKIFVDQIYYNLKSNMFKPFIINLKNLELFQVLSLGLDKGLVAKGRLDGEVEVKISKKGIIYIKGKLHSLKSGVIKYDSSMSNEIGEKTQQSAGLLVQYMKNLQYKKLVIDLESDDKYNLLTQFNLFGNNPDLSKYKNRTVDFDGKPLKLKINLELNIMKAIRSYLLSVDLPTKIEEQLIKSLNFQ